MDINALREQRAKHVADMRNILDKSESENRGLNDTETESYNSLEKAADEVKNRIDRAEAQAKLDTEMSALADSPVKSGLGDNPKSKFAQSEYGEVFNSYARNGQITPDVRNALEVGTDSEGGYIVPEEFETMLIRKIQDINPLREWCNVITTASDRNIPIESTLGAATWVAEEGAFQESDAAFGRVTLASHKLGTMVKVSDELLADSFFDLQSYLAENFATRFGLAEEAAFVAGDGSGKPTGILTGATDSGINFAGTTAITADELIDVQHALTRPYRAGAVWLVNDATLKLIRKLKDGDNQYLWQTGLTAGAPDTLLGRPIYSSTAMPTAAAGNNSVVFGDMSGYTIADRTGSQMIRLNELFAVNGQVGFRMSRRTEGKVTDSSKIIFAEQAAS